MSILIKLMVNVKHQYIYIYNIYLYNLYKINRNVFNYAIFFHLIKCHYQGQCHYVILNI